MSPEIKTLVTAMATRDGLCGPIIGFNIDRARAELSAAKHADASREDTDELINIIDWLLVRIATHDGMPDRIGAVRTRPV